MPPGFAWPTGMRAAACFTFDLDAESAILVDHPEAAGWLDMMSHQAYGPRTGGPRILRLLDRQGIQATFFVPGYTAERWPDTIRSIRDRVGDRPAFISFDIDVVDPAYAPGTGTPEAGGPSARDLLAILRGLTGIEFVGFDVVEVIPAYDPAGQTATLAANLAYEMLSLVALHRRDSGHS